MKPQHTPDNRQSDGLDRFIEKLHAQISTLSKSRKELQDFLDKTNSDIYRIRQDKECKYNFAKYVLYQLCEKALSGRGGKLFPLNENAQHAYSCNILHFKTAVYEKFLGLKPPLNGPIAEKKQQQTRIAGFEECVYLALHEAIQETIKHPEKASDVLNKKALFNKACTHYKYKMLAAALHFAECIIIAERQAYLTKINFEDELIKLKEKIESFTTGNFAFAETKTLFDKLKQKNPTTKNINNIFSEIMKTLGKKEVDDGQCFNKLISGKQHTVTVQDIFEATFYNATHILAILQKNLSLIEQDIEQLQITHGIGKAKPTFPELDNYLQENEQDKIKSKSKEAPSLSRSENEDPYLFKIKKIVNQWQEALKTEKEQYPHRFGHKADKKTMALRRLMIYLDTLTCLNASACKEINTTLKEIKNCNPTVWEKSYIEQIKYVLQYFWNTIRAFCDDTVTPLSPYEADPRINEIRVPLQEAATLADTTIDKELKDFPDYLQRDPKTIISVIVAKPACISQIPDDVENSDDLIRDAIAENGLVLEYAPSHLKQNPAIVISAICQNKAAFTFADTCFHSYKLTCTDKKPTELMGDGHVSQIEKDIQTHNNLIIAIRELARIDPSHIRKKRGQAILIQHHDAILNWSDLVDSKQTEWQKRSLTPVKDNKGDIKVSDLMHTHASLFFKPAEDKKTSVAPSYNAKQTDNHTP